ncbi:MAG: nucleotide-binding protein [Planctomycetes bacterium]|nr:nucleotide-binding protein [Planctomycetota bacterium]
MSLPIKTTIEDVDVICKYLSSKATGATMKEAKAVLDPKYLDGRKLSALETWGFIEQSVDRLKLTSRGRDFNSGDANRRQAILRAIVGSCEQYSAIVERAVHQKQADVDAKAVGAHWHDHFKDEVSATESGLGAQATTFFRLAEGAGLGTMILGRRGQPTRFEWIQSAAAEYCANGGHDEDAAVDDHGNDDTESYGGDSPESASPPNTGSKSADALGQGIFIAHGRQRKALDDLKQILSQFSVPFKVAVDEPHLGRPISEKVKATMKACNCAILIFTADEEFTNADGETVWRPSENVVYELGACSYLYGKRVVVLKEDRVQFPSNFSDLGYITFSDGELSAKSMDVIKELIGFEILKVSTG